VALAIDEAVTNVIRHGYKGSAGQPIEVVIDRVEREGAPALQVTIRDFGRQVDPAMIVGRDLEDVRPGGLGTHIIRTIMDEVEYTHRHPSGMQLRVLKVLKLPDEVASPSDASGSKESS
jgi:anti-sigma regulatory factor (Ser/Thr protein kinase)